MAKCEICGKNMLKADGCVRTPIIHQGKEYEPIKVGGSGDWLEGETEGRCGDCNAAVGHYHHPGCDCERCPICGGQRISCNCESGCDVPVTSGKSTTVRYGNTIVHLEECGNSVISTSYKCMVVKDSPGTYNGSIDDALRDLILFAKEQGEELVPVSPKELQKLLEDVKE